MILKNHPEFKGHKKCPVCSKWLWQRAEGYWVCIFCKFSEEKRPTLDSLI